MEECEVELLAELLEHPLEEFLKKISKEFRNECSEKFLEFLEELSARIPANAERISGGTAGKILTTSSGRFFRRTFEKFRRNVWKISWKIFLKNLR